MKQFIQHHNVGLVCLLESKVKASNIGSLYQRIFGGWCFISSNSSFHDGGRIIIAFKPGVMFIVRVLGGSSKALHCLVETVSGLTIFFCTFIYAFNDSYRRLELWQELRRYNIEQPWLLSGDLNCVMFVEERIGNRSSKKL